MKEININILKETVYTKYNDLQGIISIDGHDGVSEFFDLCEEKGIDMNIYFLIGFGLSEFTISGIGSSDEVYCNILLLEKEKYGETFDEISSNIRNTDSVDVVKKSFSVKYTDLGKYIKRFDFLAVSEMSRYISTMNIQEND